MGLTRTSTARLTAGVLTFLVLTAGVVAAATFEQAPPAATGQAVGATGSLGASQFSTEPLDEAATTTTTPAPAPAETTPSTSAGSSPAPPLPGHRTPGAVVTPFKAGRTEWTGTPNGIALRLVMTTRRPAPASR